MSYTLPQLVHECKLDGQPHCKKCRQPKAGKFLRLRMMALRKTGVEGPDFECPLGKPWGKETKTRTRTPPPMPDEKTVRLAEARAEVCKGCDNFLENPGIRLTVKSGIGETPIYRAGCKLCSSCGGGVVLTKAKSKCKAGKWDHLGD